MQTFICEYPVAVLFGFAYHEFSGIAARAIWPLACISCLQVLLYSINRPGLIEPTSSVSVPIAKTSHDGGRKPPTGTFAIHPRLPIFRAFVLPKNGTHSLTEESNTDSAHLGSYAVP